MEITKEILETIRNRAIQYAMASTGEYDEPARIQLKENGVIEASWDKYSWGSYTEEIYFDYKDLTEDLDEVIKRRKEEEAIKDEENKARWARESKEKALRELEERKREYEKLKKEFETKKA